MKQIFLFICSLNILIGCQHVKPCILDGQSLEDVLLRTQSEQKFLCLVLVDSTDKIIEHCSHKLNTQHRELAKNAVFNIVNITNEENLWYEKWLCPVSVPLTCIFSPNGNLIDIIPGLSYESFAYMEKTIHEEKTSNEFPCFNRFQLLKNELVAAMNEVLQAKRKFDKEEDIKIDIENTLKRIKYPYNIFIKLKNEKRWNDTANIAGTCNELLSLNTPYNLLHYPEEFTEAKKILNPNYDIRQEPYLELYPAVVEFNHCKYRERKSFSVTLKNTGDSPLKITEVETSCSCVKYLGSNHYEIMPHDSVVTPFEFIAEQKGTIERGCYFVSNARNPVVDFKIYATVED